jgi:phosphoribosyl 1,2-cyclic phosphate phosphodiesterase
MNSQSTTITFLGTGAAEGVPPPYSRSPFALRVRREGGRNLRTRSSIRIGDHHQIDLSPDYFWQMHRCDTDMYDVEHLLISHSHEDHFVFDQVVAKEMPAGTNGKPLALYLSAPAARWLERMIECTGMLEGVPQGAREALRLRYPINPLEYGCDYDIGGMRAFTVPGNHTVAASGERSINYLLELPSGNRLLYALDTGFYRDDSWEMLAGRHADLLIMDCTFGGRTDRAEFPDGHLDCRSFIRMLERMERISFIDRETTIYATHINPDQGFDHDALQAFFDASPYRVTTAYDTLRVRTGTDGVGENVVGDVGDVGDSGGSGRSGGEL